MPGYATKQENITVAGAADLIIRSLLNREQFADPLGEAELLGISSAAWPIFGLLWPSGAQLAARMAAHPVLAGERILEIGCGLGLASLVCHRRGADITASDCHPLAGAFLRHNLLLNQLAPLRYRHGHWGAPPHLAGGMPAIERELVRGRYDLIIGSDLLYERDARGLLAEFIGRHADLRADVWIVDPDRGNRPAFNRGMAAQGFSMREERLDAPATAHTAAYKGRLMLYTRGENPGPPMPPPASPS
jgi:predicted nicotinamide N-methyase